MITRYKDLPLGKYQEIDGIQRAGMEDLEMQVAILSVLSGIEEAELLRLPLEQYTDMARGADFLREPLAEVPDLRPVYELDGWRLRPFEDYKKMTTGQYIDFQGYTRDTLDFCGLLSVLLVPEGRKYADGYDPADIRRAVAEHLPMPDGMALLVFFLRRYAALIQASLTFSESALRRLKDKGMRRTMQARIFHARTLLRLAGAGSKTSPR